MKKTTFYLIKQLSTQTELENHEWLACYLAAKNWRIGKQVLISCNDQIQAKKLDKILWQKTPYQFIPHNLAGDSPTNHDAPIEISWPTRQRQNNLSKDILINLQLLLFPDFISIFHEVIDFVPIDEHLKQLARKRYKTYQSMGFNLVITAATPNNFTNNKIK